jgi:hypothetical protein
MSTLVLHGYLVVGCIAAVIMWSVLVMEGVSEGAPLMVVVPFCLTLGLIGAAIVGLLWPLALLILLATGLSR